jgi:hypothetical protein
MKIETKINDLKNFLILKETKIKLERHTNKAKDQFEFALSQDKKDDKLVETINLVRSFKSDFYKQETAFNKIPKERRDLVYLTHKWALDVAKQVCYMGRCYSGDTSFYYSIIDGPSDAHTTTDIGDQYSRKCTFRKTDASHNVKIDANDIPFMWENQNVMKLSDSDGLPLISLKPNGQAVWVQTKVKSIVAVNGWICWNETMCYHSTKSYADAEKGLSKKIKLAQEERKRQINAKKEDRRARLIARLCKNVNATFEDARSLGYCEPGIRSFQQTYNISNQATLQELMATKNPLAVKLAITVARKIKRSV